MPQGESDHLLRGYSSPARYTCSVTTNLCVLFEVGFEVLDTPPGLKPHGCSVLWGGLRHLSPKGLPGPFYVLRGVVVAVQARPTVRAAMPADG
jgi:hypothetical protein